MNQVDSYIKKLEQRVRHLENSKSYKLTFPLRKMEEILRLLIRLPKALQLYSNYEFRKNFNAVYYLISANRPFGWWRRYPAFHYCLFNSNTEKKAEGGSQGVESVESVESVEGKNFNPIKPTVILVSHSVCRTGAPILVLDLLNRFSKTHNVIVISIGDGVLRSLFEDKATIFVGPVERGNLEYSLDRKLRLINARKPEFAIVNSIESTEVLNVLWNHDIPILHLVHEFASYTKPTLRFEKSATFSDAMVFSSEVVRANSIEAFPQISRLESNVMPQGVCAIPKDKSDEIEGDSEKAKIKAAFRPKGWPENTIIVLGVGTVQLRKGLDLFISCAKKVVENNPEKKVRFVWIGSGFKPDHDLHYSCYIDDQIKRSGLKDAFTLLNEVSELQCAYDSADLFFLSSRLDPLPLVAQDALINKLPLVCFEGASGIVEYIAEDPDASFGVVPYLDVEAAAKKLQDLLFDQDLRKKVGEAGQILAKSKFDQEQYFKRLNQLGLKAAATKKSEAEDRATIIKSGYFNVDFAYPRLSKDENLAIKYYTTSWRTGIHRRKPFPGFHPGIYADHHQKIQCDPFAHFLTSGKPNGPWLSEVIHSSDIAPIEPIQALPKAALHLHLHYPEAAGEIFHRLKNSTFQPDIFISVTSEDGRRQVLKEIEKHELRVLSIKDVPNRGRDIAPFLNEFPQIFEDDYKFIGHLHGKKSVHLDAEFSKRWSNYLYENLIGKNASTMRNILNTMNADSSIGIVFPDDPHIVGWEDNYSIAAKAADQMGLQIPLIKQSINFPVGTMFWARCEALKPFLELKLGWDDYPEEPLPQDGTILHAIERLFPIVVHKYGYRSVVSYKSGTSR